MPPKQKKSDKIQPDVSSTHTSTRRTKTQDAQLVRQLRATIVNTCLALNINDSGQIRQLTLKVTQGITPASIASAKAWETIRQNKQNPLRRYT